MILRRLARAGALGAVVATLVVSAGAPSTPARSQEEVPRPNILVIVSDDQRAADTMQVMPKTVHLLGDLGTRFDQFYVTTPLCCPSRATLLSGRYAHNHLVENNQEAHNLDQRTTIEHYLRHAGYSTAIAGKFLNGWPVAYERPPFFDRWATSHGGYYDKRFNVNGDVRRVHEYSVHFVEHQALADLYDFERTDSRPWFMYLAPAPPHSPFIAEPRYEHATFEHWHPSPAVTETDRSDKPPYVQASSASIHRDAKVRKQQLRTLLSLDDLVAHVVHALHDLGETDTLIVFLSDNGYMWGEHGVNAKRVPYTPAVQVPFFMRWDGHVAAGAVDDRLGAMVDVAPTLLQAAGVSPSASSPPMDGRSLFGPGDRQRLLIEHWTQPGKDVPDFASTRTRDYQYVEYYDSAGSTTYREYYDLANDPWQLDNVLGDSDPGNDPSPDTLRQISAQLSEDRLCSGSGCP